MSTEFSRGWCKISFLGGIEVVIGLRGVTAAACASSWVAVMTVDYGAGLMGPLVFASPDLESLYSSIPLSCGLKLAKCRRLARVSLRDQWR